MRCPCERPAETFTGYTDIDQSVLATSAALAHHGPVYILQSIQSRVSNRTETLLETMHNYRFKIHFDTVTKFPAYLKLCRNEAQGMGIRRAVGIEECNRWL